MWLIMIRLSFSCSEPMQSIAESHLLGYKHGERNGDIVSSQLNYLFYLQISYLSGQSLTFVREKSRDFAHQLLQRKQKFLMPGSWTLHLQSVLFMEGPDYEEEEANMQFPTLEQMRKARTHLDYRLGEFCFVVVAIQISIVPMLSHIAFYRCSILHTPIYEVLFVKSI